MRELNLGDYEFLLLATRWTIVLSLYAAVGGGIVGLGIALMRTSTSTTLRWIAIGYIRVFQGTPLLLQLFLVFFGGDMLGLPLGAWHRHPRFQPERRRLPGRDLARRHPSCTQRTDRGCQGTRPALRAPHAARRSATGIARGHPSDGRLPGEPDQEHIARRHHWLRGGDARGQMLNNATFRPFLIFGIVS